MPDCQLIIEFTPATFGTGPMLTTLDFRVPDTTDEMEDVLADVVTWWDAESNWHPYLYSGLGVPNFIVRGEFSGNIVEYNAPGANGPTGLEPDLPGISYRIVKDGSRPLGGRRGSMFLPGAEAGSHSKAGTLTGPAQTAIGAGATALLGVIEASTVGNLVIQRHNVGGTESTSVVTSMTCQSTVSFLQRRYR